MEQLPDRPVELEPLGLRHGEVALTQQVIQLPVRLVAVDDAFPAEIDDTISRGGQQGIVQGETVTREHIGITLRESTCSMHVRTSD